jgi:hypothetical protein
MDTKRKSKKKLLIILGSVLIILLLAAFLVPRLWVASQFNKEGNILFCNFVDTKVYEMTTDGIVVWSYDLGRDSISQEYYLPYLFRLSNGNTVITDAQAGKIYEVTRSGEVIWSCDSIYGGKDTAYEVGTEIMAFEVINGNILAANYSEERGMVFEVDRDCNIIWQWTYEKGDPDCWGENISHVRHLTNRNTGVLIWKICTVDELMQESRTSDDFEKYLNDCREKCLVSFQEGYLELDSNSNIVKRRDFDEIIHDAHCSDMLSNGHVLISYKEYGVAEYNTLGKIIWSFQPPESSFVRDGLKLKKQPTGAWGAFRCSNGNTVIYYPTCWIYVVDPHKNILSYFKSPVIKSRFGIKYVTEEDDDKPEDEIDNFDRVLGVVNK